MHSKASLGLKIAAIGGLLFLHLPILLIFVYAWLMNRLDKRHGLDD